MISEKIVIDVEGSNEGGAYLVTYIHELGEKFYYRERPLIIVCPGGGYEWLSEREGEILALQFMAMGYHAAVLHYSVRPAVFPTALLEVATAVRIVKENAARWNVSADRIFVEGCSAGGHVAASLGTMWNKPFLAKKLGYPNEMFRPAGMILSYPVITSGEYAHRGSFCSLLGAECENEEKLSEVSLENCVSEDTVPAFIWHTFTDGSVPVENSLLFVTALRKYNINTEFHMFPVGGHGCSTAKYFTCSGKNTEEVAQLQPWIGLVNTWLEDRK